MTPTVLTWAGGEHAFGLDIGALRALQQTCDAGPEQILQRIVSGAWKIDDLFQTVRLRLITGGMSDRDAAQAVTTAFQSHPPLQFKPLARMILLAALVGVEDDPLGETTGAENPPESGSSQSSTATAQ